MGSVLSNLVNPIGNILKGNIRAVADPLKAFGNPDLVATGADGNPIPDYLTAYQQGVDVDTATLQQRRLMDAAAQLGGVYADGRIMSQAEYQQALDYENKKLADAQAAGDKARIAEAQTQLGKLQGKGVYNFQGAGSADLAQQQLLQEIAGMDQTTRAQLDLEKKYGNEAATIARDNIRAIDPTGFDLREQVGKNLADGSNSVESLYSGRNAPTYEQIGNSQLPQYIRQSASDLPALQQLNGGGPSFDRLGAGDLPNLQKMNASYLPQFDSIQNGDLANLSGVNGVRLRDSGQAAAGRSDLEKSVFDQLSQVGQSDPALQRSAEQAARARGAASGNILGDGSALQESLAVQLAQRGLDERRRAEALGLLSSGQTTSDKNNELQQLQLQNDMASTGFNNQSAQQGFSNRSAQAAFNNQNAQQAYDNRAALNDNSNSLEQLGYSNRTNQAGFNNDAAQREYGNSVDATGFNNQAAQQNFANRSSVTAQNNTVSDQAFNSVMAALGQRNQATQNTFNNQNQLLQQQAGARQQDMANQQSYLGLQPVSAQAGGYQNMSTPFNPGNVQNGVTTDPAAGTNGAQWYSQLYGNQQQSNAANTSADAAKKSALIGAGASAATAAAAIIAI